MEISIELSDGRSSAVAFAPLATLRDIVDPARTVIVTDPDIRRLHGAAFPNCPVVEVPRGEAAKSLPRLEELYGSFLDAGLGRDGLVIAVGGGTVSDLAGFAASTWLRGVAFGFVPTTLLAMVDASVGGKNGVDFRGVKNLIGSFSQPEFVRIDVGLLDTLSDREFSSGMAEVVKHAVLAGGEYFELVESASKRAGAFPAAGAHVRPIRPGRAELETLVEGSIRFKAAVVERDEHESGERRLLNLGHTIGHGIEVATGLPHGHSVAAGLASACRFAARRAAGPNGGPSTAYLDRITRILVAWGLPSSISEAARLAALPDGRELRASMAAAAGSDKKRRGGDILMAMPRAIGRVEIEAIPLSALCDFVMEAP